MRAFIIRGVDHECSHEALIMSQPNASDEEIDAEISRITADGKHSAQEITVDVVEIDLSTVIPDLSARVASPDPISQSIRGQKPLMN